MIHHSLKRERNLLERVAFLPRTAYREEESDQGAELPAVPAESLASNCVARLPCHVTSTSKVFALGALSASLLGYLLPAPLGPDRPGPASFRDGRWAGEGTDW